MNISKSFKPTIAVKIIRRMRRIDKKPIFLYVNLFTFRKNPKRNHVFVIMLRLHCRSVLSVKYFFITIIRMYENSDNESNRKSVMINIIIRMMLI